MGSSGFMLVKKYRALCLFLVFSIVLSPLSALGNDEISPAPNAVRLNSDYFSSYITDTANVFTAPTRWDNSDWLTTGVVVSSTVGLFFADRGIRNWTLDNRSGVADKLADFGRTFGEAVIIFPALTGIFLYGLLSDDDAAQKFPLLALKAVVITSVVVFGIKFLAHRHRPDTGDSSNIWDGPSFSSENLSFASGHASTAFALATVVADVFKDHPYMPIIAYTASTITALSRIYDNRHWASDVFFGAIMGHVIAKSILSSGDDKEPRTTFLLPYTNEKTIAGLQLQILF